MLPIPSSQLMNLACYWTLHCFIPTCTQLLTIDCSQFLMPGFVDTHFHPPQYPAAGLGLGLTFPEWTIRFYFPTEVPFSQNATYARQLSTELVVRTLSIKFCFRCCSYDTCQLSHYPIVMVFRILVGKFFIISSRSLHKSITAFTWLFGMQCFYACAYTLFTNYSNVVYYFSRDISSERALLQLSMSAL